MTLQVILTPLAVFSSVVVLTKSDLLARLISTIKRQPPMLTSEFEAWLFTIRFGFFYHKLYTCSLCQAFHTAWVSTAALYVCGIPSDLCNLTGFLTFLGALAYLNLVFPTPGIVFPGVPAEAEDDAPAPRQKDAPRWKEPKKLFVNRLITKVETKENGATSVHITGMDDIATRATALLTRVHVGEKPPHSDEIVAEYEKALEKAILDKCPKCEEGKIRRRYLNYLVALLEDEIA